MTETPNYQALRSENDELRTRLAEAEETLRAIQSGEIDALVVGDQVYTLESADAASNRFRGEAMAQAYDAVIAVDNEFHITYLNPAAERLYGVLAVDVLGFKLDTVRRNYWLHPTDEAAALQAIQEKGYWFGETRQVKNNGVEIYVEATVSRMYDQHGVASGMMAIIRDITEQKRSAIIDERYHLLSTNTRDVILFLRPDGKIVEANETAIKTYGYDYDTLLSLNLADLRAPESLPLMAAQLAQAQAGGIQFEVLHRHQDGTLFPVEVSSTGARVGGEMLLISIIRDITERKRTEEALHLGEERLALAISATQLGIWDANLLTTEYYWSSRTYEIHGLAPETVITPELITSLFHPDDLPLWREAALAAFDPHGNGRINLEHRFIRPDGTQGWAAVQGHAYFAEVNGKPRAVRLTGSTREITEHKQAEENLRQSEERLRLATEAAEMYSWAINLHDRTIKFADNQAQVLGFALPENYSAAMAFVHPADRADADRAFDAEIKNTETFETEYRLIHPHTGATVWVCTTGVVITDARGLPVSLVGVTQNITSRKEAEEKLRAGDERMRLATQVTGVGVWEWNVSTNQVRLDAEMFRIYGIEPTEDGFVQYEDWSRSVLPEDLPEQEAILQDTVQRCGNSRREFRLRRRSDGEIRNIEAVETVRANAQGQAEWVVGTNLDVTERERLLAQEQQARETAEAATRAKDEFVALVSHELRNPLNSILGYNRMLQQGGVNDLTRRKYTDIIETNARRQLKLLEDLLDTARMVSGKLKLDIRPCNFVRAINEALDAARPGAEAKQITLATDLLREAEVQLTGDPDRLQQVVWNLLTNAIKFTPTGGAVIVALAPQPGGVQLTITDTGKGIAAEVLPAIFDRFSQADASSSRRQGGLGLGLALVKQLVEMHGGTIAVASDGVGQGATFTITLPWRAAPQPSEAVVPMTEALSTSARLAGVHILVVDDEADAREVVTAILTMSGAQVTAVASADAALALLTEATASAPAVLVSDIGMPEIDGYALLRRVRLAGLTLPAVAVTAFGRMEDRVRALAAGFQMHVPKPVEPEELVAVICSLTNR